MESGECLGIIRGDFYLLYIILLTKSCQSQARGWSSSYWVAVGLFHLYYSLMCLLNFEVT